METSINFSEAQRAISVKFKNLDYLKESLTHRSYLNENPNWGFHHNERLEFLGDAVLELIVTEELLNRFPQKNEGELTALRAALVNYINLSAVFDKLDIGKYILMSKGEKKDSQRARTVILANAFESVLGAIYLDLGYETSKKFVIKNVMSTLDIILKNNLYKDYKSLLQETVQSKSKVTPHYRILSETGPEHEKFFVSGVFIGEKKLAEGAGYSKQESENVAAKAALEQLSK